MSQAINEHVSTGTKPCINKAIRMLLIHGCETLRIRFRGRYNLTSSHIERTVTNIIFDAMMTFMYAMNAAFSKCRQVT